MVALYNNNVSIYINAWYATFKLLPYIYFSITVSKSLVLSGCRYDICTKPVLTKLIDNITKQNRCNVSVRIKKKYDAVFRLALL